MHRPRQEPGAYTLIEVLVVVAIIGTAGAVVVPQLLRPGTMGAQAAGRAIIADVLFAQNEAIAHQKTRNIVFDRANSSYQITDENDDLLAVAWKGGGQHSVSIGADDGFEGVSLGAVDFGGQTVLTFDDLGTPVFGGRIDVRGAGVQYRINVAPFTGRVTIDRL